MKVCRADSYTVMPWKNGGGSTTEIAVSPEGASLDGFYWRFSMARIERDGPFSSFPGIDRTLTLLDGKRVELRIDSRAPQILTPSAPTLAFAGEDRVEAAVPDGPITDFNVMTRRARCRHRFEQVRLTGEKPLALRGMQTLVFLAEGDALRCRSGNGDAITLGQRDCLILEAADPIDWHLDPAGMPATVFLIAIEN
jgi:environmental stress-induced protein Ves